MNSWDLIQQSVVAVLLQTDELISYSAVYTFSHFFPNLWHLFTHPRANESKRNILERAGLLPAFKDNTACVSHMQSSTMQYARCGVLQAF